MPKCPKCNAEIDILNVRQIDYGVASIDEKGEIICEWAGDNYGVDVIEYEFSCPECGEKLFDSWEDAEAFLQQDVKKQKQTTLY